MALEDALLKLADAINNHAEAIKLSATVGYKEPPTVDKTKGADAKPDVQTKKQTGTASTAETRSLSQGTPTVDSVTTSPSDDLSGDETPEVDVAELKTKFIALVNKDRSAAEGILTELGFTKLNLVPANLHAKTWGLITKALGEATNG